MSFLQWSSFGMFCSLGILSEPNLATDWEIWVHWTLMVPWILWDTNLWWFLLKYTVLHLSSVLKLVENFCPGQIMGSDSHLEVLLLPNLPHSFLGVFSRQNPLKGDECILHDSRLIFVKGQILLDFFSSLLLIYFYSPITKHTYLW